MRSRLTKLDKQLKEQMNRIIETRSDGLTFHYKAIDQVRADGQQLVNGRWAASCRTASTRWAPKPC